MLFIMYNNHWPSLNMVLIWYKNAPNMPQNALLRQWLLSYCITSSVFLLSRPLSSSLCYFLPLSSSFFLSSPNVSASLFFTLTLAPSLFLSLPLSLTIFLFSPLYSSFSFAGEFCEKPAKIKREMKRRNSNRICGVELDLERPLRRM